uniref:Large ribosomal subunit protein uL24c n=1 Tax=Gelidium vagum TaxID=35171 RepID=A0A141SED6_GELVA|nr:ribosomal protein L24 [Gelidium vagum]AMK96654.1 ribosomal protein L24 [Gelidium vagum]
MRKIKKIYEKIHINKGDKIEIISGKHKGKIAHVKQVIREKHTIIIENLNKATKHIKPKKEGESGQILFIEQPIHSSNVRKHNNNRID